MNGSVPTQWIGKVISDSDHGSVGRCWKYHFLSSTGTLNVATVPSGRVATLDNQRVDPKTCNHVQPILSWFS